MPILTSNLVSVYNPDIPTQTSVLADPFSLSTVRYPLLDACIWDASRNPLLANLSYPVFSYWSLLTACWSVIAAYCSSLATRLIVPLASRSSTCCSWYSVAHCVIHIYLLAGCFRWRYYFPAVRRMMFTLRFSLCAIDNLLLTATSLLFARRLLLGSCFLPVGALLSRCSPLAVHCTLALCLLHAIGYYNLEAHGSPLAFFCFRLVVDKMLCPPRSLFLAVCCVLPTSPNPLILVAHCRLRAIFSTPLVLDVHSS